MITELFSILMSNRDLHTDPKAPVPSRLQATCSNKDLVPQNTGYETSPDRFKILRLDPVDECIKSSSIMF